VADLRRLIDFIPQWRVDDVMVSYAVDGGSAGPHYDNYDVFLLQGHGQRNWKIGQFCDRTSALLPHDELRILENFDLQEEHILNCGDILYIPPGYAHWGIALGECTTFSIGFRAPRIVDMVSRWTDQLLERLIDNEQFFRDEERVSPARPGEIDSRDMALAQSQLQVALQQASGDQWFGELLTEPRNPPEYDEDELMHAQARLTEGAARVELSTAAKLAWQQEGADIRVFANGDSRKFPEPVLATLLILCGTWQLNGADLKAAASGPDTATMLDFLLECGVIHVR
jgi:50S ribosomal protein L16 3-hydroxylase